MPPWAGQGRPPPSSACRSRSAPSGTPNPDRTRNGSVDKGTVTGTGGSAVVGDATIGRVFREESGRSVATLIRIFGQIDIAEDAVQEAFALAMRTWPEGGLPSNPGAWITTTARNWAINRLRRESRGRELLGELAVL